MVKRHCLFQVGERETTGHEDDWRGWRGECEISHESRQRASGRTEADKSLDLIRWQTTESESVHRFGVDRFRERLPVPSRNRVDECRAHCSTAFRSSGTFGQPCQGGSDGRTPPRTRKSCAGPSPLRRAVRHRPSQHPGDSPFRSRTIDGAPLMRAHLFVPTPHRQASATSNPATFRVSLLNSTPIR